VRREDRRGFKAGALAAGLAQATGELVAVFDADFTPHPDFLEATVPHLGPGVAAVQARWGHLNADASGLTRAQALALDGHFVVEQTVRDRAGLFVNFSGTAGVWRREAIVADGGWQADTLSEDIDLSYRAQLAGWRLVFLPDVVAPAELPATLLAFKRQQRRWAKGTTRLLVKLASAVLRSPHPAWVRLHAVAALAGHLAHPLMLGLLLGAPLLLVYPPKLSGVLAALAVLALGPPLLYAAATVPLYRDWPRRLAAYPLLAVLSAGLTLNGTAAVCEALFGRDGSFERTPKLGAGRADPAGYVPGVDWTIAAEGLLAVYAWLALFAAWAARSAGLVPFLGLFATGFTLSAALSLHGAARRRGGRDAEARLAQQWD
jgi:cellulose synthase/poly-beta-1,6-N-acetylglucosamine synthase-like glycosyltransferase